MKELQISNWFSFIDNLHNLLYVYDADVSQFLVNVLVRLPEIDFSFPILVSVIW